MKKFKFDIGEKVELIESGEQGTVTGRAEYDNTENSYLVRYKAADGRQQQCWWEESAIK